MKKTLATLSLTLVILAVLDGLVAATLAWAERNGQLEYLVRYFDYGRSVPGKLAEWAEDPNAPGNLFDVAWRSQTVALSKTAFQAEADDVKSVVRTYGMSFVNNIMKQAVVLRPDLTWDGHAGPAAPPNFTYSLFQDDRAHRHIGDIVVLGILSSSVPAMAALSNRTWLFEQPAPLTYPVYRPEGDGLRRIEPRINSAAAERALSQDAEAQNDWQKQLAQVDAFYSPVTFGFPVLDASPFARLVRRSLAKSHIENRTADILRNRDYPYTVVLPLMIRDFAQTARADGQNPVVVLIQTGDPKDADIMAIAKPVLDADDIPYFATVEHFDPRDLSGFLSDGHYKPRIDRMFAKHFLSMLKL